MSKSCRQHMSTVYAAHTPVMFIAVQLQCLLYQRGEILPAVLIPFDMPEAVIADNRGCIHPVTVAFSRRHYAVCGEKHRRRNIFKLFLLILPCGSKISGEMIIFFQSRIPVRRKHFTMRIDIYAGTLCLIKQFLQIPHIMAGNYYKRPFLYININSCRNRITIAFGIRLIQKLHTFIIHSAKLQYQRQPFLNRMFPVYLAESLIKPF